MFVQHTTSMYGASLGSLPTMHSGNAQLSNPFIQMGGDTSDPGHKPAEEREREEESEEETTTTTEETTEESQENTEKSE